MARPHGVVTNLQRRIPRLGAPSTVDETVGRGASFMPHRLPISIGSTVWVFGRGYKPHTVRVASETSRSWVLADGTKVPKGQSTPVFEVNPKFGCTQRYCLTREAADEMLLMRSRWAMAERIRQETNAATLRAVAVALGMAADVGEVR